MCGFIGYIGKKSCKKIILDGLSRIEYRGYDSAGIVCIGKDKQFYYKKESEGVVSIKNLYKSALFDGNVGIGHTRWATHGEVTIDNAHPHFNYDKTISIVHNGIIEGFEIIKKNLIDSGVSFVSQTDTEVIVHLFSNFVKKYDSIHEAIINVTKVVKGSYSVLVLMKQYPDQILVIRQKSPVSIGIGIGEVFVASDLLAFSDKIKNVIFMPDCSYALIKKDSICLYDFEGNRLFYTPQKINYSFKQVDKGDFKHFMLKEICEQKKAINRTVSFCRIIGKNIWKKLGITSDNVKNLKRINLVAAGTSWHASKIAKFFFEIYCKIPVQVHLASEFLCMPFFYEKNSLFIFVSQSGETADVLQVLDFIKKQGLLTVALTNVPSSSIVREAGGFLPTQAGPEISVASTKAFSTQIVALYWLANRFAFEKGFIDFDKFCESEEDIFIATEVLDNTLELYREIIINTISKQYAKYDRFIFLGRHISYPFALEAALKLKEISYLFSQCYPAGELKHGPIALVDEKTPIIIFSVLDEKVYWKLVSNAQEVKARKGHIVVFAFEGQKELIDLADTAFIIPRVVELLGPLAMTGLMQFLMYQITCNLNCHIDKPRNLAKSVTVE